MAANLPTILFNGERRILELALEDASGQPLDVSGWTMRFYLGGRPPDATLDVEVDVIDGPLGYVDIPIEPSDIADLKSGSHEWALRRVDTDEERVIQTGNVAVRITYL